MYYIYFDSGTSYSRIFLSDGKEILDYGKCSIGSKDISIAEENRILVEELKNMYDAMLRSHGFSDADIAEIYASGMVTSPFGIREIPHISLPVNFTRLQSEIVSYYEPFCFKRELHLIPGVKNVVPDSVVVKQNFADVNSTRGEEFEVFGLLAEIPEEMRRDPIVVLLPGSHTQILYIRGDTIYDVLSTISGELFHAIGENTILSDSIVRGAYQLDGEMLLTGFAHLQKFGFNRALYLVNTMKIFSDISRVQKTSYLEGVITGGVILILNDFLRGKWRDASRLYVAGSAHIARVYELLLRDIQPKYEINPLLLNERCSFSARAFLRLMEGRKTA